MSDSQEPLVAAERVLDRLHMRLAQAERELGQLRMLLQAQRSHTAYLEGKERPPALDAQA